MKEISNLPDAELIKLAQDGEDAAFAILVTRYESRIAKTVIGMLGDTIEADDVGQETFVRFYRSLGSFRGDAGLGTYLTRIAINLSLNELKRRKRKSFFFYMNKTTEQELELADNSINGDREDVKEVVSRALQVLESQFRSVIVLRMIDGYSTKETAKILKLPEGTVLSRLARAQNKLKNILGKLID